MTRKIWRYAHLSVAFIIFIYLLIASVSGAILGIYEATYSDKNQSNIPISSLVEKVSRNYGEIISLKKNKEGFIEIQAYDEDYNEIKGNINPETGKISLKNKEKNSKNEFIDWLTTLHRSLFLDTTGRILVGIFTVLFLVELITGVFYMLRAVPKIRLLFTQWKYGNFALTYHHSVSRIVFFPLFILAITGSVLFFFRYKIFEEKSPILEKKEIQKGNKISVNQFPILVENNLENFISLEFPFDESEGYHLETKQGKYELDYSSGQVISQEITEKSTQWKEFSYSLHTGKIHYIWAWVISLASLSIPGFVITGFMLFYKRKKKNIKNNAKSKDAKIVVLYGSENGTTRKIAYDFTQLIKREKEVFFGTMNEITHFPNAEKIIVFTATYGDGDAPSNADKFLEKLKNIPVNKEIKIAIVGFGSRKYDLYNQFSIDVVEALQQKGLEKNILVFEKIDSKNAEQTSIALQEIQKRLNFENLNFETVFSQKKEKYRFVKILKKTPISLKNHYCSILLEGKNIPFENGDLLKIKIPKSEEFRYYSIAKMGENIALFVKYLEGGKCSEYLKNLSVGDEIEASVEHNENFHFENKPIIMISNGTGIAPYLGILNSDRKDLYLYAGFRYREEILENIQKSISNGDKNINWVYSDAKENGIRVTACISRDIQKVIDHLLAGNIVMICGALSLKKEVENQINQALSERNISLNVEDFYLQKTLKADCY